MRKIPTLFERVFEGHKIVGITDKIYPGMEWVLEGEGVATLKIDGSCCAIINGEFYKRYDAKGKKVPDGAIPCCEPDPVTGHFPHWVKVDRESPADRWFRNAIATTAICRLQFPFEDGTYEAVGVHFQGNPYNLENDFIVKHGTEVLDVPRTFEGIKKYLEENRIEGIVFWKDGEPQCKIKRSDFGYEWNGKKGYNDI
ncbi:MAG: hypothetical protein IKW45_05405 [Clostridia bacterium]|nr:hypothetical protein [Clostridia bacterium]